MKIYFITLLISLLFIGCGNADDDNNNPYAAYYSSDQITYDYYEIADGNILHTAINEDIVNISRLFTILENEHMTEYKEFIDNYSIINTTLDINETVDVYKENYSNLFTNKSYQRVLVYDYGLREVKTNYCTINVDVSNCETYVYVRKI